MTQNSEKYYAFIILFILLFPQKLKRPKYFDNRWNTTPTVHLKREQPFNTVQFFRVSSIPFPK